MFATNKYPKTLENYSPLGQAAARRFIDAVCDEKGDVVADFNTYQSAHDRFYEECPDNDLYGLEMLLGF